VTTTIPLGGNYGSGIILAAGSGPAGGESIVAPHLISASDGYFDAMHIPLLRGRYFDRRDTASAPPVVIVDQRLARRFWPDCDAVGQRVAQARESRQRARSPDARARRALLHGDWRGRERPTDRPDAEGSAGWRVFFRTRSSRRGRSWSPSEARGTPEIIITPLRSTLASIDRARAGRAVRRRRRRGGG